MTPEEAGYAVRTGDVSKIYQQEAEEVHAVRDVSLTVGSGEFTALAGPSGSGKTTLLNLIGGLTRPTRGQVWVGGQELSTLASGELARLRLTRVGFIFQAYNLLPVLTARENAEFPMLLQGVPTAERTRRVDELFSRTGLNGLEDRRPGKLSGGQQQRVAVVRAVASQPALVLADEPTANLDAENSHHIMKILVRLNQELSTSFIFATHDEKIMAYLRRIIHLDDGEIIEDEKIENPKASA